LVLRIALKETIKKKKNGGLVKLVEKGIGGIGWEKNWFIKKKRFWINNWHMSYILYYGQRKMKGQVGWISG